jgi:hypothetical protein
MAEPFLCKNCSLYLMVFMAAPFADLHSKHGRAISVQRLPTVMIDIYGRAICRLKHFKCGRAIQGKDHSLYLSICMAVPFANLCDLKSIYGRAILLTTMHTTAASG